MRFLLNKRATKHRSVLSRERQHTSIIYRRSLNQHCLIIETRTKPLCSQREMLLREAETQPAPHCVSRCDSIPLPSLLWQHIPLKRAELSVSLMTRRTQQRLLKFRVSRVQLKRGLSRVSPFKCDSAEVSWPWSHVQTRAQFNCSVY
jgi:hypothetical protein